MTHLTSAALIGMRQGTRSRWARRAVRPRGHAWSGELLRGGERRQCALITGLGWGPTGGLPELRHVFGTATHRRPYGAGRNRTGRRSAPDRLGAGQGLFLLVWRVKDSNLGRHQPTDLQSVAKRRVLPGKIVFLAQPLTLGGWIVGPSRVH